MPWTMGSLYAKSVQTVLLMLLGSQVWLILASHQAKVYTLSGTTDALSPIINTFDVLSRRRRELVDTEIADVLISSEEDEKAFEKAIEKTDIVKTVRRFNVTACLEAQNSRRRRETSFEYDRYHELHEIHQWMADMAAEHSGLVTRFEIARSYDNIPLYAFKISTGKRHDKKAIWIDGGIHAREWISPATVIYFVKTLLGSYETDSTIRRLLDVADWYILPVFNVDGYIYSWENDRMWRKTRSRQNGTDCVGADPNRNWDFHWGEEGSMMDPCSSSYVGRHAFSEVEVREVANFIRNHPEITVYLTYHNAGQKYIIPWGYTDQRIPHYDELMKLCFKALESVEAVHHKSYRCNPVTEFFGILPGVSNDYVYGALGVKYSYAVELRDTPHSRNGNPFYFCLPEDQILDTAQENFAGLQTLLLEVMDFSYEQAQKDLQVTLTTDAKTSSADLSIFESYEVKLVGGSVAFVLAFASSF